MVAWVQALEILGPDGKGSGKFRMTRRYDDPESGPFGLCEHEHATREEAESCPDIPAQYRKGANKPDEDNFVADLIDAVNAATVDCEGEMTEDALRDAMARRGLWVVRA